MVETIYNQTTEYCVAIYKGGSSVDPVIENTHDTDYILFAKRLQKHNLLRLLNKLGVIQLNASMFNLKKVSYSAGTEDFSQVRSIAINRIDWFSYLDILMVKVIGEDVCPKTDVINQYRVEFLTALKQRANLLITNRIKNQKRWYHILRGVYILLNNSYEVTDEQKREINILHDLSEGWEEIRDKTITLLNSLDLT